MTSHLAWFAVVAATGLATAATVVVIERLAVALEGDRPSLRPALTCGVAAVAVLLLLGMSWAWSGVAGADASVVELLENDRKEVTAEIFNLVTSMGDAVPMVTVATAIAVVLFMRGAGWSVALIPLAVITEQVLQVGTFNLLPTLAIDEVLTGDALTTVVAGNAGTYPSGSVARLTAVFGVAALVAARAGSGAARALGAVGGAWIVLQAVTRLYLGRHLLIDVVGGLALGLVVVAGAGLVLALLRRRRTSP